MVASTTNQPPEEEPTRKEMETVLENWGVLPEGVGILEDDKLVRRYKVFNNINFGYVPSARAI